MKTSVVRQLIRISLQPLSASRHPLYSADSEEILMVISAHESGMGKYLRQIIGKDENNLSFGKARGLCGIEPDTMEDNYTNFLNARPDLKKQIYEVTGCDGPDVFHLQYNHLYNIIHARLKLYRSPGKLPSYNDPQGMAEYAKNVFNTPNGAATAEKYLADYKRLVL